MVVLKTGNVFSHDGAVIGHGVNTRGVMGAGIATQVRRRYPEGFKAYVRLCRQGLLLPGEAMYFAPEHGTTHWMVNLVTQDEPGPNARLEWVDQSLRTAVAWAQEAGHTRMALPRIGCGIGGLRFDDVLAVLEQVEDETGFSFEVWTLTRPPGDSVPAGDQP